MKIDIRPIQSELEELIGEAKVKVKVKLDKHLHVACSVRQTDRAYLVRLNPTRIRSPQKLDNHLNFCRQAIVS